MSQEFSDFSHTSNLLNLPIQKALTIPHTIKRLPWPADPKQPWKSQQHACHSSQVLQMQSCKHPQWFQPCTHHTPQGVCQTCCTACSTCQQSEKVNKDTWYQ